MNQMKNNNTESKNDAKESVNSSSYSDWRNDEYTDIDDDFYDSEPEYNSEAENCHCGAYRLTKKGWQLISDCCC